MDQLEGRNPVFEALARRRRRVARILLDERARPGGKIDTILELAREQGVPVERVPRRKLDRLARGDVHNGVVAQAEPLPRHSVNSLLAEIRGRGEDPFLLLADEVSYEHNLGAILRSALGAGVHGVVVPVRRGKGLTPVVQRVAMGAAEEVALVREGIPAAQKRCRKEGLLVVGADMDGQPCWDVDLTGPLALVLGGESKGVSETLRKRCDHIVSVPLQGGLESLNVSVTAAVLMFERERQLRRDRRASS
ncbi:MAG TPA: 23S rRNA (guanosine(2251)-2'-O)-methyltransferase RlmB [Myxococcota bacterium]|jgi:23S rRNA (guanosine2251-2'-O)-methyltransferase|nr:23S rRNA (guanosine(2251)-2'-O)-methyltransferase RlmB [Myxococcota bacterium]